MEWQFLLDDIHTDNTTPSQNNINKTRPIVDPTSIYDLFNLINKPQENKKTIKIDRYCVCPLCNTEYAIGSGSVYCKTCGEENGMDIQLENNFNISQATQNYNTIADSYMALKIVGKGAYHYNKSLIKICSDYANLRRSCERRYIYNMVYQYDGNKIPKSVVDYAIGIYETIKMNGKIFRGNRKSGIIGSCLYYACLLNNIPKQAKEIIAIIGTEDRFLSMGDKVVQDLNNRNIIKIDFDSIHPVRDYTHNFMQLLDIPLVFAPFVIDLIKFADDTYMHGKIECRVMTKCAGAILLLCERVKSLNDVTCSCISKECDISKNTVNKYHDLLVLNYKKIKHIFKRHQIPMPIAWKE